MKFKSLFKIALTIAAAILVSSCSKDEGGEITPDQETSKDHDSGSDKRETYDISFNGTCYGSDRFREVFEFVDSKGNAIEVADVTTKKYRFREGLENWKYTTDASSLFSGFNQMTSVELPDSWGNVTNVRCLFAWCTSLLTIKLPDSWGNVTYAESVFASCTSLSTIKLPDSWGNVTNAEYMFILCSNLSSITLPSDWGKIDEVIGSLDMFSKCPLFKTKEPGKKVADDYYKSPSTCVFPEECYRDNLGLEF